MLGFIMSLCLVAVAIAQQDGTTLRHQLDELSSQVSSLREKVQQKELYVLEQDEVILDLQRQLQGMKAGDLEAELKQKEQDLLDLRGKIQSLQLVLDRQGSEIQHLEIISASQKQQLDEGQQALHLIEELMLQAQAQADQKDQDIGKAYAHWLPRWAIENWQGTWVATINKLWKRAVHLAVCGYQRLLEIKLLKRLVVLEVHFVSYMQRVQDVVEEQVHGVWDICKGFVGKLFKTLEAHSNQSNSFLQPSLFKLKRYLSKALKYGIKCHLELQRKIRKVLHLDSYLASKESKEVVWFLASVLLILPLYGALLLSSYLGRKRYRPQMARAATSHRDGEVVDLRRLQR